MYLADRRFWRDLDAINGTWGDAVGLCNEKGLQTVRHTRHFSSVIVKVSDQIFTIPANSFGRVLELSVNGFVAQYEPPVVLRIDSRAIPATSSRFVALQLRPHV